MSDTKTFEVMPVEIYEGACGHIVICQEWPELGGESYARLFLTRENAKEVCRQIMAIAAGMDR